MSGDINTTKYYSIIEFSKISDIVLIPPDLNFSPETVQDKNRIIILALNYAPVVNFIAQNVLQHIHVPFIIITGMEDTTFPTEHNITSIDIITNHQHFVHWFAINKIIPDDNKFTSIPYGLDYWTLQKRSLWEEPIQSSIEQDNVLSIIAANQIFKNPNKQHIAYVNAHLNDNDYRHGNIRKQLLNILPPSISYFESTNRKRNYSWNMMSTFRFVVSPFGNGLDCIRTFEALCLGCIPIVLNSPINTVYNDLPVLIVDNYSEVTEQLLTDTLHKFSKMEFNYEKLTMNYWIKLVLSKFPDEI